MQQAGTSPAPKKEKKEKKEKTDRKEKKEKKLKKDKSKSALTFAPAAQLDTQYEQGKQVGGITLG